MKPTLRPGLKHSFSYTVPIGKTVPAVTVGAECIEVRGPRAKFAVRAHDGIDEIGSGTHERFIMAWDRFNKSVAAKAAKANAKVDA
jgi:fluoroacetyl-CoA thioesterase